MTGEAEALGRVGMRAIPVVGELLMLTQTIKFLGDHSKDIGRGIGIAAGWIVAHGGPMIVHAFMSVVHSIWDAVSHPGNFIGGLWYWTTNAVGGLAQGVQQGYSSQTGPPIKGHAAGGYVRRAGLGYLHGGEVIVKHRTVEKLERMTSGGRPVALTQNLKLAYSAPAGESDALHRRRSKRMIRELAAEIAEVLADNLGFDLNSGSIQDARHSIFAMLTGVPS